MLCFQISNVGQYGPTIKLFRYFILGDLGQYGPPMKVFGHFVLCGSGRQGSTTNINFRTFVLSIDDHPFQSETANDSTTYITSADATATRKELEV